MGQRPLKLLKSNKLFLGLILIFFLATRLYKIAEIPGSLYWDEASIGYNAYSIGRDLKDEWGEFLPLHFRAFGEFKLPVYIYATALSIKFFGLNEFAVRFPAVLFSLGVVALTYFLVLKIFKKELVALLALFYLTISPWFFIFSRTGYEATAGVFFFLLGIYFFLWSLQKRYLFLLSTISYILAIYSYNSLRLIAPVFLLAQSVFVSKTHFKFILFSFVLLAISLVPIARLFYLDYGNLRFSAVGEKNPVAIFQNYFSHFDPKFLLAGDKNPRSTQPGYGVIWPLDLVLVPLGIYSLFKTKKNLYIFIFLGFLLGPLPAAITKEAPHALRALSTVPFIAMFWALGVYFLMSKFKKHKSLILAGIIVLNLGFSWRYWESFILTYNSKTSEYWQSGYKKLFRGKKSELAHYGKVIVSDKYAQPYIFGLFYLQYEPEKFRQEVVYNPANDWGFSTVASFANFEFKKIDEEIQFTR